MRNSRPEGESIIKDIKYFFRLEKESKAIKDFFKPARVNRFRSNNYIEYESNDERNKALSVEEFRPYLKYIINNLKKLCPVGKSINNSE